MRKTATTQKRQHTSSTPKKSNGNGRYNNSNGSLDMLLARPFESFLKESIGQKKFQKIQKLSQDAFGHGISDCITSGNFENVFFLIGSIMNKQKSRDASLDMIEHIATRLFSVMPKNKRVILIHDKSILYGTIYRSFSNPQKSRILEMLHHKSIKIVEIPKYIRISPATCRKHAREMISDGLLVTLDEGYGNTQKENTYTTVFSDVSVTVNAHKTEMKVKVKDDFLAASYIYRSHPDSKKFHKRIPRQVGKKRKPPKTREC